MVGIEPNRWPFLETSPPSSATVGLVYEYAAQATDPDGGAPSYVLVRGPAQATVDPATGQLCWTPSPADGDEVSFELRAYDARGGYARQQWSVAVHGVNTPNVLVPPADRSIREGDLLEVQVGAYDAENDPIVYWVENLPPGATFDGRTQTLRWQTSAGDAGRYGGVTVCASDGTSEAACSFEILVANLNQAPRLDPVPARTLREGDTISFRLQAVDPDGDAVQFSSPNLPVRAVGSPDRPVLLDPGL